MSNLYLIKLSEEIAMEIASRVKNIRKSKKLTQKELSIKCGVSYGSIKRFEQTGEISFISLIDIARSLDILDQLENLFSKKNKEYKDIQEVIDSWKR